MKTVVATIKGISTYSQSKHYSKEDVPLQAKERPDDYEKRTWRGRIHATSTGHVFIPPMCFKNCLSSAAKFLGVQIPGKGKSTFTKHFEAGVLVLDGPVIQPFIKKDDVQHEWLFVPASGKRGDGKRVMKCFPVIPEGWTVKATFHILDDTITRDVFEEHLKEAGRFIGIGRFRPQSNGYYGRFTVEKFEWEETES